MALGPSPTRNRVFSIARQTLSPGTTKEVLNFFFFFLIIFFFFFFTKITFSYFSFFFFFLAALGLCWFAQLSLVAVTGATLCFGVRASLCGGLSC